MSKNTKSVTVTHKKVFFFRKGHKKNHHIKLIQHELGLTLIKTNSHGKFQLNMSKHVLNVEVGLFKYHVKACTCSSFIEMYNYMYIIDIEYLFVTAINYPDKVQPPAHTQCPRMHCFPALLVVMPTRFQRDGRRRWDPTPEVDPGGEASSPRSLQLHYWYVVFNYIRIRVIESISTRWRQDAKS